MMITTKSSPGKSKSSGAENCCADPNCGLGLRNQYFDGKRLTTASFSLEQTYGIEHRHLLNRAIHGWGLVYGYAIDSETAHNSYEAASKLKVSPGLVLDRCGRELYLPDDIALSIRDVMVLDENGMPVDDPSVAFRCECAKDECWQLCAHYAEYDVDPINQQDTCNCTHRHWDKVCETVRFSLRRVDCRDCCPEPKCELECHCERDCCCDPGSEARVAPSTRRGGCSCLCEHLTHLKFEDCGRLCEVEGSCCRTFRVALKEPVPLACVKIVEYCGQWTFGVKIEECGPRPLVRRNDLLFDLIRGCDLTRITDIGWREWHRSETPIAFEKFDAAFGPHNGTKCKEYVTDLFWVEFSGPVRKDTVRADCVAMQVLTIEKKDVWLEPLRVPIVRLDTSDFECKDHPEWVTGFKFVVEGRWREEVYGSATIFDDEPTQVEIEIRTDFIADCNGQAVDGNSCGLIPAPTGKGTPGGGLLSTFTVGPPDHTNY
jgi:hypothetical protein